ncbi:MAG TPA: STAS domain-containing protein [Anaeromyxobacter sp.]|nr:STAS domain-containing protein [Anaeromyxobacter sp.]
MFSLERNNGGETRVKFQGILDASAAREVRAFLSGETEINVTLDFSQSTDVDYYGLSTLVAEIISSEKAVRLRGLRSQHVRMLRYFGVDPARFDLEDNAVPEWAGTGTS